MINKKNLNKFLLVLSSAALLQSCTKRENNSVDQLANLGKGTISGKVSALLVDTAGAARTQYVGAGRIIHAWVDTRELVLSPAAGAVYARKYYTTTTDANGVYSFSIEVSPYRPVMVNIQPSEFEADVTKKYTSGPDMGKLYNERQIFTPDSVRNVSISKDQNLIIDINFTQK